MGSLEEARSLVREAARHSVSLWVEADQVRYRAPPGALGGDLQLRLRSKRDAIVAELSRPEFTRQVRPSSVLQLPQHHAGWWRETEQHLLTLNGLHLVCKLTGAVQLESFYAALASLSARHELLRARAQLREGVPFLLFDQPEVRAQLVEIDPGCPADLVRKILASALWRGFPRGTLFRPFIIRTSDREYIAGFVLNHGMGDLHSCNIIARELFARLSAPAQPTDSPHPPSLQYWDYLRGMQAWYSGPRLQYRLDYWRRHLHGVSTVQLPETGDIGSEASYPLDSVSFQVGAQSRHHLAKVAEDVGVSMLVMVLAAKFATLMAMLGRTDIVLMVIQSGRDHPALLDLVGTTLSYMPLRITANPALTAKDFLQQVHEEYTLACRYRIPWDPILEIVGESRVVSISPLVNFIPADQVGQATGTVFRPAGSLAIERMVVDRPPATGSFVLNSCPKLTVHDTGQLLYGTVTHIAGQYRREIIDELIARFIACLEKLADDPQSNLAGLIGPLH